MKTLLVTGSSGLIGSEVADFFHLRGWRVHGVDNNARASFFGPEGDTRWNQRRLESALENFTHHELDIRNREHVAELIKQTRPDSIVHAAAQPSHDLAARIPFEDFHTNATGTLNLLEAARQSVPESPFVLMSTNKVYGDAPNELSLVELDSRWDYSSPENRNGIDETMRIDQTRHSLFGASKVAADVLTQEYGRYFEMPTVCLRGGCLTGPTHSGVELHGFLSYLIKANELGSRYSVYGYKGKQVRDNIHAFDVASFIESYIASPRCGEVYNIGGGRENSCSILEAFDMAEERSGKAMKSDYLDHPRLGDHVCYISDLSKARTHYPSWKVTRSLDEIFDEIHESWRRRTFDRSESHK
jgi:CDP-paratose 2-epimerase